MSKNTIRVDGDFAVCSVDGNDTVYGIFDKY